MIEQMLDSPNLEPAKKRIIAGVYEDASVKLMEQAATAVGISFKVVQSPGEEYPLKVGGSLIVPEGSARVWIEASTVDEVRAFNQEKEALKQSQQ